MTSRLWVQECTLGLGLAFASVAAWQKQVMLLLSGTANTGMDINNTNLTLLLTGIILPGLHTQYCLICSDEGVWEKN